MFLGDMEYVNSELFSWKVLFPIEKYGNLITFL